MDPDRDTQEVLARYVPGFDPSFVALRGSAEQTAATAKEFKVFYQKVAGKTATSYSVDHTAGTYIIDRDGRVRLFVKHGEGVEPIVATTVGYAVSLVFSYILNRRFTFHAHNSVGASFAKFAVIYGVGLVLNAWIVDALVVPSAPRQ